MILRILLSSTTGIIGFILIKIIIGGLDTSEWDPALKVFATQLTPIVIVVVATLSLIAVDYNSPVQKYIRYKRWDDFGNRLKVAYAAKFGGKNPAFDEKVEQDILAVKALGKGFTKSINMDNLKALAKFVEVPFIIPEEEYLSEKDKTKSFGTK